MTARTHGLRLVRSAVGAAILLAGAGGARAADYVVRADGAGDFRTIQACADTARAGDTCLVAPGTYPEHVVTTSGGTAVDNRVTFRAQGTATMQGFDIRHPFVTVQGFDITGYALRFSGLIRVFVGGDDCRILQNTVRDGAADVYGVYFYLSDGRTGNRCEVRGNRLSNLRFQFISVSGDDHLFEGNTLEYQNNMDYIRVFGAGHIFRRNVFWRGTSADAGNHPDFVQSFGMSSGRSENHLFEENWIQDLQSQFCQINSGDGVVTKGILYSNVKDVTFRRNVIVDVGYNGNVGMPGVRFENNTFLRLASQLSGLSFSGSLTRGDPSRGLLKNNIFLAGGSRPTATGDFSGFYTLGGAVMSREVIGVFITSDPAAQSATTAGIFDDLKNKQYINSNGKILDRAKALTAVSQLDLDAQFGAYKAAVYDYLTRTVRLDTAIRGSFQADYNYVAGAASAGYPAKASSGCVAGASYTEWNFCEPHGMNGGDPGLRNALDPLGPDGVPFTLDDGLKPLPTSRLCGKGEGGADIGAYSCNPNEVFPGAAPPRAPTNVTIR